MNTYRTHGTCSQVINFEVENNIIKSVEFVGGCSGEVIALGVQYLCQRIHTAAADADEVEPVDSLQQTFLIAAGMICHSQSPQCHKV